MDALPSGPSGTDGGFGRRPGRFADDRQGSGPSSSSGGPVVIDQSRLPTCAPYTAFIGSLPFEVTEADVRTFFQMRNIAAGSILNVKLPRDTENKARGFGYVEFASCDDLTRALLASNQFSIKNRTVRIDFSDSKGRDDREPRPAESNKNWRDGAGFGAPRVLTREAEGRDARPVSAAESSRNWRDGATPVERSSVFSSNARENESGESRAPRAAPVETTPRNWRDGAAGVERTSVFSSSTHEGESRPPRATAAPVFAAAEPARNWRDTAKPVEKAATSEPAVVPAKKETTFHEKPAESAPAPSKVPAGSWRK